MSVLIKGMGMPKEGHLWEQSITKTPMSLNDINSGVLDSCPIEDYPIESNKETDEFELIEDYYNE